MSIGPPRPHLGINTDTVHLMALDDQLRQLNLWVTAARTTVQVLLAKRAPEPQPEPIMTSHPFSPPQLLDADPPEYSRVQEPTKAALMEQGLALDIPESVLRDPKYLNGTSRPSKEGLKATQVFLGQVKALKAAGQDPSPLWEA